MNEGVIEQYIVVVQWAKKALDFWGLIHTHWVGSIITQLPSGWESIAVILSTYFIFQVIL